MRPPATVVLQTRPCSKPFRKNPAKSDAADLEINSNANPYSSYASVKTECERALNALRRGNHTKALRLMKDLCSENENYPQLALIHRVQGTVLVKMASIIDDPNAKHRHLKNAIESARRAVSLSPDSIEFAHFYANLLYEDAKYEEVVQECERALMIEEPVDPAEESLLEENMGNEVFPTAEARVAHFRSELHSLIQKSNIASISIWMKNTANVGWLEWQWFLRSKGKSVQVQDMSIYCELKQIMVDPLMLVF
ncbi:hypothetical protein DH2020_040759 [Rehmannia glutinosa]|uniref:DUF627 domain-containing protein n=1 Tax=Rehmannia glutinosa TaxID=99300 RepID=A0ABR0US34_REHGL